MSSSTSRPDKYPLAASVAVDRARLHVALRDGRELSVPVAWFEWLADASDEQRADHEIIEDGQGIWWEHLDEGVSVPGLFGLAHT
jgi:hypothetical protein